MSRDVAQANAAILLTPPGSGAIATIRIHGSGVATFLSQHFSATPRQNHCVHGRLTDSETIIDDPVVVLSADSAWAELHVHGGPWVVQSMLALLERTGFGIVAPDSPSPSWAVDGETEIDREIQIALPLARTELSLRILLAQKEAWADLQSKIENQKLVLSKAEGSKIPSILADRSLHYLLNPPRVAIIGIPNVGKSTLANQLFAQERSITADLPGTTRDWVGELANLDGLAVMLVDTPGIRSTTDSIEQAAIAQSRPVIEAADLILLVLDVTQPLENGQCAIVEKWPAAIRVINKSDRQPLWDVGKTGGLPTVATTGVGIDDLRQSIRRHFGCDNIDPHQPRVWTARQRAFLESAC